MTDTKPMTGQTHDLDSSSPRTDAPEALSVLGSVAERAMAALSQHYLRIWIGEPNSGRACDIRLAPHGSNYAEAILNEMERRGFDASGAERRANTPDATGATMTTAQRATSDEGQTETASVTPAAPALKPEGGG